MGAPADVLVVDSQGGRRRETAGRLAGSDASPTEAESVADAMAAVTEAAPDCVVTELSLADGDGIELVERLRAAAPSVPVVLYTGDGDERVASDAVAAGAARYVPRSASDTLSERVTAVAEQRPCRSDEPTDRGGQLAPSLDADSTNALVASIVAEAPLPVVAWTQSFRVADWNEPAAELFGYEREAGIGMSARELVPAAAGDRVDDPRELLQRGDSGTTQVTENVRADGSTVVCEWHSVPIGQVGESRDGDAPSGSESGAGSNADATGDDAVGVLSFPRDVTAESEHVDRLDALREASRELRRADDLRTVADRVVDLAAEVIDRPLASVRLYDPEKEALVPVAVTDELHRRMPEDDDRPLPAAEPGNVFWDAYCEGEQSVVDAADATVGDGTTPVSDRLLLQPLGDHGLLVFGGSNADGIGRRERYLATVLGASAETALDRLDTERALANYGRKVARLHGVGSELLDADDPETVYNLAVTAAQEVLEFDASVVSAARDDGDRFEAVAVGGDLAGEEYYEETDDDGLVGRTLREGETLVVDPVEDDVDAAGPYRTVLSAPIGEHAVFQAASREVGAFDERDVELAEVLLAHVGQAVGHVKTERALRTERDRLSTLRDSVPDPVMRLCVFADGGAAIEDVNDGFVDTFGFAAETLRGEDPRDVIVPPDEREPVADIRRRLRAGETVETELRRETTDGVRQFEISVVPVDRTPTKTVAYALYRDVTERNRRRRRLAVLNRILRHDVRNAMNVVGGYARSIRQAATDERVVEWTETIGERAEGLLSLAERARSAEEVLDPGGGDVERCDIGAVVRDAADTVRTDHPEAEVALDGVDSAVVGADPNVDLAVSQLLRNAVVHHDGKPTVEVAVEADPETVTVAVTDDGPGIPDVEREVLTGERPVDQLHHGSGLGLWLVKWVVVQSGGELAFETHDCGTTVRATLPRSRNDSDDRTPVSTD
ncbi:MAG: PAS domain S-box protein [Halolamina sp.]